MKYVWATWALICYLSTAQGQSMTLGSHLQQWLTQMPAESETQELMLTFRAQAPTVSLLHQFEANQTPLDLRAKQVLAACMGLSENTKRDFLPQFEQISQQPGAFLEVRKFFWIANAVEIRANATAIKSIFDLNGISQLELSSAYTFMLETPDDEQPAVESPNDKEPGLAVIGAPALWQMGYTGRNRKAMLVDTGVWPDHPALNGKFLGDRFGLNGTWLGYDEPIPRDKIGTHGTHVIGTVLGLDTATNDTIGLAFGAYFIATDPIVTDISQVKPWSELILAFEWAINPDGDTSTTSDIPDVINNSWGRANAGMDSLCGHPMIVQAFSAVEAAGIANVFSAGNNGPGSSTGGVPAQLVIDTLNLFAVGALDGNIATYPIAAFSSRGPTTCPAPGTSLAIKPEVSAPGVNVRSANGRNGYGLKSGTSMAAPHVSGAVLLLKEAFPMVSGRQILNALYQTATDLGSAGEDNVYGRGLINLPAAFAFLANSYTPASPANNSYDLAIAGIDSPSTDLIGSSSCDQLNPNPNQQLLRVRVVNLGDSLANGFQLVVMLNGVHDTLHINQPLPAGEARQVSIQLSNLLPASVGNTNLNDLHLEIIGQHAEVDELNNHWHLNFRSQNQFSQAILNETFDSIRVNTDVDLIDWLIKNQDQDATTWGFTSIPAPNGANTAAAMPMRNYGPRNGQIDELISPGIGIGFVFVSSGINPTIAFDMAYSNRPNFRDSLFVEFQPGCERPFFEVYRTGGDSMRTFTGVNPIDSSQWERITINFPPDSLRALDLARIKFKTKNDFGGNLYLTNLTFYYLVQGVDELNPTQVKIYPNPVNDQFQVTLEEGQLQQIEILDLQGRTVQNWLAQEQTKQAQISVQNLSSGMYILQISTNKGAVHARIIKP